MTKPFTVHQTRYEIKVSTLIRELLLWINLRTTNDDGVHKRSFENGGVFAFHLEHKTVLTTFRKNKCLERILINKRSRVGLLPNAANIRSFHCADVHDRTANVPTRMLRITWFPRPAWKQCTSVVALSSNATSSWHYVMGVSRCALLCQMRIVNIFTNINVCTFAVSDPFDITKDWTCATSRQPDQLPPLFRVTMFQSIAN